MFARPHIFPPKLPRQSKVFVVDGYPLYVRYEKVHFIHNSISYVYVTYYVPSGCDPSRYISSAALVFGRSVFFIRGINFTCNYVLPNRSSVWRWDAQPTYQLTYAMGHADGNISMPFLCFAGPAISIE